MSEFGPSEAMVGTSVVVEGARFQVRRVLAEGGKAIVFQVQEDGGSGKTYAMKRVVVSGDQDRSVLEAANREVEVLRRFAPAENIVNLRAAERKADRKRRLYFYFIVMAFCPKTVLSIMREAKGRGARGIARPVVLQIMRDKARAVFGGGRAMARHGLSLNRSANLALAKRARKLALDLEAHFDPEGTPSVLIEEGIAMTHEVA